MQSRLLDPAHRRVVVVLGARSGTSALTGTFGLLGCTLPKHLMQANHSNPRGHFEPQDIADLHDRLLSEIGSAWHDWRDIPASWFATEASEHHRQALQRAFLENYGEAPLCVLKEPRICRLLPLWDRIFLHLQARPLITFMHRHPFEVAHSLQARDGSSIRQGLLFYLRSNLAAELATRQHPRIVLSFDALLGDWRASLGRWQAVFGTTLPAWGAEAGARVDAFLARELRHQADGIARNRGTGRQLMDWACALHHHLGALGEDAVSSTTLREVDQLRMDFDRFTMRLSRAADERQAGRYPWSDRLRGATAWLRETALGRG